MKMKLRQIGLPLLTVALTLTAAFAQDVKPQAPDDALNGATTISTRIGNLDYVAGFPTPETAGKLRDEMDFRSAVQAYTWGIPAVGTAQLRKSFKEIFKAEEGQFVALVTLEDKRGLHTPDNVAPYIMAVVDLSKTGPLMFEDPKGNTAGAIFDLWRRTVVDIGIAGPFKGEGGKILILGPGQSPHDVSGYHVGHHVVRSTTYNIIISSRLLDPDVGKSLRAVTPTFQAYPFKEWNTFKVKPLIQGNARKWGEQPPGGPEYFERLSEILQTEPVQERDRFIMAMLAPLGIEKGKPFQPDARQRSILADAAVVGKLTVESAMATRRNTPTYWPNSSWKNALAMGADQRTENYDHLEERGLANWDIFGGGIPSAKPGTGSYHLVTSVDKDGLGLAGGKSYRLHIPANPPAKAFWSVTAYDEATRSFFANTDRVGLGPQSPGYLVNPDGSVDVYFGPRPPKGLEKNWVATEAGKAWFGYFRFFGPTKPFFDKTWTLGDFEEIK